FTPNGDGKNDVWEIENIHLYPDCDVSVFNRWGQLVFSAGKGYDNSWDGTYKGKIVPNGVYVWSLHFKDENNGDTNSEIGRVTVIR
ncbi:MAG: gliding motility-associated C-terminal domain-containing protein, partial [Cohaesibacteraceae bacterium]|nr:gliding motility-associated C-terminal domain-containing protein [Cohaesibacteraceae bacterium]